MTKIPQVLHEYINSAFPQNVCLVGTLKDDGWPNIAPRGSTQVFDDETLAIWDRGGRASSESITDGTKLMIYYRNPALGARGGNGLLAAGGVARFYGTAEIHREDPSYEQVWNNMAEQERNNDPDKKGFAILIRIIKVESLLGKPLPEDLAVPES